MLQIFRDITFFSFFFSHFYINQKVFEKKIWLFYFGLTWIIYLFKACFYGPGCSEHNILFTTQYCGLYFKNRSTLGLHKICSKNTDQIEKDLKKTPTQQYTWWRLGTGSRFLTVIQILRVPCSGYWGMVEKRKTCLKPNGGFSRMWHYYTTNIVITNITIFGVFFQKDLNVN